MSRQFTALRVVSTIFKVLAWLSLVMGVLAAFGGLLAGFTMSNQLLGTDMAVGGPLAGIAMFIVFLVLAILYFLILYAGGEFIALFLCIEENTRRAAYFIQQQAVSQETAYYPPGGGQG